MNERVIPLALRDTPPSADAWVRLTGIRLDGLPDGCHTGGAWHNQTTGEVWKPLDARPGPDCPFHEPTREAEALALVAGEPAFPCNWRVEFTSPQVAGELYYRRWLVRRHATVIDAAHRDLLTLSHVLDVEQGLRALNRRGWGVNDAISVALDEGLRPFILDLSNAGSIGRYEDEEYSYWLPFLRRVGYGWLADLRAAGRGIAHGLLLWRDRMGYHNGHVYAGLHQRPKRTPRGTLIVEPGETRRAISETCPQVRWWLVRPDEDGELPQTTLDRLGLLWAWSPIRRLADAN
ncbi:MAG: hypothetical protein NT169_08880 [Chloroflexi bacterium]|nr:hypothetical protein [Chloroflexota bacterium]